MKFTCEIKNGISVKDIDTAGYIVVLAIYMGHYQKMEKSVSYTSHTGQYMPKDAVFECSVVCSSVIIEFLPGLIPFTSKWYAG